MSNEIQLISDGDGLAVIGNPTDVERFLHDQGLDLVSTRNLDLRRLGPLLNTGGAATKVGSDLAVNSGRWVKLTAESAKAVQKYGLMATKNPNVSHAMIGKPGEIKQWIQIAKGSAVLLSGPMALSVLSTMMLQAAIQAQVDEVVEYLQEINEKVDDILRSQKDAVLADMIGVDLVIEEALIIRDQVGRVSDVTWSKVQGTSMTLARTQAYALRQLDAIAEKLDKRTDARELAKEARAAESKVREWLAVLARCFQLQCGVAVLELDRVLDSSPGELEEHRLGLTAAQRSRLDLISRSTTRMLIQVDETIRKANSKVLFNPLNSPATVRSSSQVAGDVLDFRGRLGIESSYDRPEAKRWGLAATEVRDKVFATTTDGVDAARRFGADTFDKAAEVLRPIDMDGDGVPDKSRAMAAAEDAGLAIKGAAVDAAGAVGRGASHAGSAIRGLAGGSASAVGSLFRRKQGADSPNDLDSEITNEPSESSDV